jgi:hypothetical protein
MKWLRWCAVYAGMWLIASMVMTRTFNWPKDSEMTAFEQTGPGQISTLIGSSLPSALTGIVLGSIGPLVFASQQVALLYGREFDTEVRIVKETHPGWTKEQCSTAAAQASNEAAKTPQIIAFLLGVAVIAIAWLTRPWKRRIREDEQLEDK